MAPSIRPDVDTQDDMDVALARLRAKRKQPVAEPAAPDPMEGALSQIRARHTFMRDSIDNVEHQVAPVAPTTQVTEPGLLPAPVTFEPDRGAEARTAENFEGLRETARQGAQAPVESTAPGGPPPIAGPTDVTARRDTRTLVRPVRQAAPFVAEPPKPAHPQLSHGRVEAALAEAPSTANENMLVSRLSSDLAPMNAASIAEASKPTTLVGRAADAAGRMAAHPVDTAVGIATAVPAAGLVLGKFAAQEERKKRGDWEGPDLIGHREAAFAAGQLIAHGIVSEALPYFDRVFGESMSAGVARAIAEGKSPVQAMLIGYGARTATHAIVSGGVGAVFAPDDPEMGALLGAAIGGIHAAAQMPWVQLPAREAPLAGSPDHLLAEPKPKPAAPARAAARSLVEEPPVTEPDYSVESAGGNSAAKVTPEKEYLPNWDEKTLGPKPSRAEYEAFKSRAVETLMPKRPATERIDDLAKEMEAAGLKPEKPVESASSEGAKTEEVAPKHDYSSTQFNLPAEHANAIAALAKKIPDAHLAEDGRETEPHITVKYGLHDDTADKVRAVLKDHPPVPVTFGKTSMFPASESGKADVVKVDIDSPELHALNKKIADAIPHTDTHPEYKPHAMVAYVKPGEGHRYVGDESLAGRKVTLDRLSFSNKNGEQVDIPLTGQAPAAEKDQPAAHHFRDLLDKSHDDLQRLADAQTAREDGIEAELFGPEGAKKYAALQRRANSLNHSDEQTGAATRDIERMESTLTPEQQNRLFGIGEKGLNAEELRDAARWANAYAPHNTEDMPEHTLRSTVGRELTTGSPEKDLASAMRLRGAVAELSKRSGEPTETIIRKGLEERVRQGHASSGDAVQLFADKMKALRNAGLFTEGDVAQPSRTLPAASKPAIIQHERPSSSGAQEVSREAGEPVAGEAAAAAGGPARAAGPGGVRPAPVQSGEAGTTGQPGAQAPEADHDLSRRPPVNGPAGHASSVFLSSGKTAATRYRLVEADELHPSHDAFTFAHNPAYPKGVQGREYFGARGEAARQHVQTGALRPDVVLDAGGGTTDGPPVITPHGIVVAGNDRTMRLQRTATMDPEAFGQYKAELAKRASQFGLTPEAVQSMRYPVLARELTDPSIDTNDPKALADFNRESDTAPTKTKDQVTAAMSRAKAMGEATGAMQHLADTMSPEESVRDYLGGPSGRDLVRHLVSDGVIAQQELPAFVDHATNSLHASGKQAIEDLLYAAAIGDADVMSRAPADALRKIGPSIPAILSTLQSGDYSLSEPLRGALDILASAAAMRDEAGTGRRSVEDFLAQRDMFGRAPAASAADLARFIEQRPQGQISAAMRAYANLAREASTALSSHDMFGYAPSAPEAMRKEAFSPKPAPPIERVGEASPAYEASASPGSFLMEPGSHYDPSQGELFAKKSPEEKQAMNREEQKLAFGSRGKVGKTIEAVRRVERAGLPTSTERLAELKPTKMRKTWVDLRGQHLGRNGQVDHARLANLLSAFRNPNMEVLHVLLLDQHGVILSHVAETSGALNWANLPITHDIIDRAKRLGATHAVIAHNHPSGDPTPSQIDRVVTMQLGSQLQAAGITLAGHLVIDHHTASWLSPTRGPGGDAIIRTQPTEWDVAEQPSWTPAVTSGHPRVVGPADAAHLIAKIADPTHPLLSVFYLDATLRLIAVEPRPVTSAESIDTWMGPSVKAHAAFTAVVVAPRSVANQLSLAPGTWSSHVFDILGTEQLPHGQTGIVSLSAAGAFKTGPRRTPGSGANRARLFDPDGADANAGGRGADPGEAGRVPPPKRVEEDLFGNADEPTKGDSPQESLFVGGERRSLANTEAQSRSDADRLRQEMGLVDRQIGRTTDETELIRLRARRRQLAAKLVPLEKLLNRDKAIGADELSTRAAAGDEPDRLLEESPKYPPGQGGSAGRVMEPPAPYEGPTDPAVKAAFRGASQDIDFTGRIAKSLDKEQGSLVDRLYRFADSIANAYGPIERLGERVEGTLPPSKNPWDLLTHVKNSDYTVGRFLNRGIVNAITRQVSGPSFKSIFAPFDKNPAAIRDALTYVVQKRIVGRGLKAVAGDQKRLDQAQTIVRYGDQDPVLRQFANDWKALTKGVLQYAVDSGLWTRELADKLEASDVLYVRFKRILTEDVREAAGDRTTRPAGGASKKVVNVTPGIKRFHGSKKAIENPAESFAEYIGQIISRADRYRVGASLFDAADALGDEGQYVLTRLTASQAMAGGKPGLARRAMDNANTLFIDPDVMEQLVRELDVRFDDRNPIIWRNGPDGAKQYAMVESPVLWKAVAALHAADDSALRTVLDHTIRPLKRVFTAMTTGMVPSFAFATNPGRDIPVALAQTRAGLTPKDLALGYTLAAADLIGKSDIAAQAKAVGLGSGSMFYNETSPKAVQRRVAPTSTLDKVRSTIVEKNPAVLGLRAIEHASDASDKGPRFAEYMAALRKNAHRVASGEWTLHDLRLRAATMARPVTLDFSNKPGSPVARFFADYIPFFGAALNGSATFGTAVGRNPKRVGGVAAAIALAAAFAWALKHRMSKEDEDAFNDRPATERSSYILVPIPGGVLRIPMSQELGVIAAGVTYSLDKLFADDPEAGKVLAQSFARALPPGLDGSVPIPGVQQYFENKANRRDYGDKPIEPGSMQNEPVAERRYDTTPPTFDAVAIAMRRAGVALKDVMPGALSTQLEQTSPLKAENLVRGVFSKATPLITTVTDPIASRLTGRESPQEGKGIAGSAANPMSVVVHKGPPYTTESETEYYDLRKRASDAQSFFNKSAKAVDRPAIARVREADGQLLTGKVQALFARTDAVLKYLKDEETLVRVRRSRGTLTPEAAAEQLDALRAKRQDRTRAAMTVIREAMKK